MTGNTYGMFLGFNLGSKLTVRNNQIKDAISMGIFIDDNDWGAYPNMVQKKSTEWIIMGNYLKTFPEAIGLYISDTRRTNYPDEGFPQLIDIKLNTYKTQDGGTAIYGLNNVDAKIWNNWFIGTGSVGVMLDGTEATNTWAENNKIMANNFTKATYTDAAVLLGSFTKNCTVVGVASDLVVDLGVNNKVIGVKAQKKGPHYQWGSHGHLKSMHENMMKMRPMKPQS